MIYAPTPIVLQEEGMRKPARNGNPGALQSNCATINSTTNPPTSYLSCPFFRTHPE